MCMVSHIPNYQKTKTAKEIQEKRKTQNTQVQTIIFVVGVCLLVSIDLNILLITLKTLTTSSMFFA